MNLENFFQLNFSYRMGQVSFTNESCLILTISLWNSIFRPKIGYEPYLFFTRSQIERLLFYKLVDGRENLI